MKTVRLAAWNEKDGLAHRRQLELSGLEVQFDGSDAGKLLRTLKDDPPGAVVIDLTRSPAQGRDLGVALRVHGTTRHLPLVFVGGTPEKVSAVRRVLPDAEFTSWEDVDSALERAWRNPPPNPVVPESALAGYSGTPLPKKLGIRASSRVLLVAAPADFPSSLGGLPAGARLLERHGASVDLILWFVRSRSELDRGLDKWAERVGGDGIWILWPKKSSGVPSDLTQAVVRRTGLSAGLVDYKIAAVDSTWSGLKFARRKKGRPSAGDGESPSKPESSRGSS